MRAGTCAYCKGNVRPLAMVKCVALHNAGGSWHVRGKCVRAARGNCHHGTIIISHPLPLPSTKSSTSLPTIISIILVTIPIIITEGS